MKVVGISDTHSYTPYSNIPDGDVIVHAGDFTSRGSAVEVSRFAYWFGNLPHTHKITIVGNHELTFESDFHLMKQVLQKDNDIIFLHDSEIIIDGIKFYGSPWQPEFYNWAFNLPRNTGALQQKWDQIPQDTDIVITHGPVDGILDWCENGTTVGCKELANTLFTKVKPKVHIFGHIHESYGAERHQDIVFINASTCNARYMPVNQPIVFEVQNGQVDILLPLEFCHV